MPDFSITTMYAMYVIGEVESNWSWTSVYRADPITIGMMQEYGQNASNLLKLCKSGDPEGYAAFSAAAPQLASDVENHGDSWNWWTSRYVTNAEANAWVTMAQRSENHRIQQQKWIDDFAAYTATLEKMGLSRNRPQVLVFAACMYHQSPRSAGNVIGTAGGNATLDRMYQVCMNNSVLGKYRNRYNTAYSRLKAWDGESAPPDFGQVGGTTFGGNPTGISEDPSMMGYILEVGNTLVLYGNTQYKNGVVFYPAGGQRWVNGFNADGTAITGGNTGGGSAAGSAGQQAVVDLMKSWIGKFKYSQGSGRLNPVSSGYGDCSSTIWYAYQQACGIDVGTWTGAMAEKGRLIGSGSGGNLPESQMQLGDLVIFFRGSTSTHVEMYIGDNQLIGHGSGMGPKIKPDANAYAAGNYNWNRWQVRRYL